jgi:hypothetical protein
MLLFTIFFLRGFDPFESVPKVCWQECDPFKPLQVGLFDEFLTAGPCFCAESQRFASMPNSFSCLSKTSVNPSSTTAFTATASQFPLTSRMVSRLNSCKVPARHRSRRHQDCALSKRDACTGPAQ